METIKGLLIKDRCSLFKTDIINVIFDNCRFDHLILSDIKLENVHFINCTFDHVFLESFYAKHILVRSSEIRSLSLRGNRKITSKRLLVRTRENRIESITFENSTDIVELTLGGDLQVINCEFPQGDNYLHIKNPLLIYSKCLQHIDAHWHGEEQKIGLEEMRMLLSKQLKNQNEDFVSFTFNEYLDKNTNDTLRSVFLLVKEVSVSMALKISR